MIWTEQITIGLAILLGFLVQTVTGFAGGLIGLPILLLSFEIAPAVAIISLFNLAFSLIQVSRNRKHIDLSIYRELAIPTAIGVGLGVTLLSYGQPSLLKKALGVFILLYIAYRFRSSGQVNLTKLLSILLGLIGGFFAGLFSSGAPPFVVYVVSKYTDPKKIRANTIGILAVTNILRPTLLIFTGVLGLQEVVLALWGIPGFLLALLFGERIFYSLSKNTFMNIVMIFLTLSALMLILR